MDQDLKRELSRIQRQLAELTAIKKKETWVSCSWVSMITGWNKEKLRQARNQKIVEYKESETGGYLYKLESIPEQFIKQKQAS